MFRMLVHPSSGAWKLASSWRWMY